MSSKVPFLRPSISSNFFSPVPSRKPQPFPPGSSICRDQSLHPPSAIAPRVQSGSDEHVYGYMVGRKRNPHRFGRSLLRTVYHRIVAKDQCKEIGQEIIGGGHSSSCMPDSMSSLFRAFLQPFDSIHGIWMICAENFLSQCNNTFPQYNGFTVTISSTV